MNAIQFIKDYGVDKAREVVATCHKIPYYTFKEKTEHGYSACKSVDLVDLKRLVESVAIVESLGGIDQAKLYISLNDNQHSIMLIYRMITSDEIKQAIADYESIYSNDMGDDSHIENHVSPNCKVGVK